MSAFIVTIRTETKTISNKDVPVFETKTISINGEPSYSRPRPRPAHTRSTSASGASASHTGGPAVDLYSNTDSYAGADSCVSIDTAFSCGGE